MIVEHLIDFNRENRIGISETIFCENKSTSQINNICKDLDINKTTFFTRLKIDTYKKQVFIYGISLTANERKEVISEAKEIPDIKNVIASIILVEDLRIQKN